MHMSKQVKSSELIHVVLRCMGLYSVKIQNLRTMSQITYYGEFFKSGKHSFVLKRVYSGQTVFVHNRQFRYRKGE